MGMSATQARYLSLVAQQSNLEYQGQQINQERSVLSQQVSELYNSLLNMQVPTPPSTSDYTKVEYQGSSGATKFSIPAANIKPGLDGKYCVTFEEESYGDSLSMKKGYSVVTNDAVKKGSLISSKEYNEGNSQGGKAYIYDPETKTVRDILPTDYQVDDDGKPTSQLKEGLQVFVEQLNGPYEARVQGAVDDILVAGASCYTLEDAYNQEKISIEEYNGFRNAINNTFPPEGKNAYGPDDFYIFKDSSGTWHFTLQSDADNNDGSAVTYDYIPNGKFKHQKTENPCGLTFDAGSGRITAVQVPVRGEGDVIVSYTEVELEAVQVTDELAYDEAVNKYEYAQYEYDRQQQEINARTEVIQQQDRNLELKLQRLDTQRQQITTEIEALEKVLQDNIEGSYKTFSG